MYAPTSTIETVTVVRPLKVIALLCLLVAAILLVVCLASTTWLRTDGFQQGLFEECLNEGKPKPPKLDFAPKPGECQPSHSRTVYIQAVAVLLVFGGILTVVGLVLTAVGLYSTNSGRKYLFYKAALYSAVFAIILEICALVTFPVCFYLELKQLEVYRWDFDWAYGLGWGALVFTLGAAILLICDKEHEEIYYKEKTIMHSPPDSAKEFIA